MISLSLEIKLSYHVFDVTQVTFGRVVGEIVNTVGPVLEKLKGKKYIKSPKNAKTLLKRHGCPLRYV